MKLIVTDRASISMGLVVRGSFAVISIRDTDKRPAKVRRVSGLKDVLRLAFHDAEPTEGFRLPEQIVVANRKHGQQVCRFLTRSLGRVDAMVVHCEQGMSRSPAVATIGEELPSYADVKNVRGPSQAFADALRGCALFNLDDTLPVDHTLHSGGKNRSVTDWSQFSEMARARSHCQIPRILAAMEPLPGDFTRVPGVIVCCGNGVAPLFRQLLEKHPETVTRDAPTGFCVRLPAAHVWCPVLNWWHPSRPRSSETMFTDFREHCARLFGPASYGGARGGARVV